MSNCEPPDCPIRVNVMNGTPISSRRHQQIDQALQPDLVINRSGEEGAYLDEQGQPLLSRLGRVLAILQVVLGTANHGERTGWCSQRRQPSHMMSVSMLSWRCSTVCTFPRPSATPCPAIGLEDGVIVRASRWPSPGGDYDHRPIPSS